MRAVLLHNPGAESRLSLGDAPDPVCGPDELLLEVAAFALNRGDLAQRAGRYPPPPGASEILGLECAGRVLEVGDAVSGWQPGERVMALLPGGGYATRAVVHAGSAMRVPERLSLEQAAAVPEVFLTVFLTVFELGAFAPDDWLLVHGGGSGIGTAAIQLANIAGGKVLVTAGTDEKCARCEALGATRALNYKSGDFAPAVLEATRGRGVDVLLDSIAAPYLAQNLKCLAPDGRLIVIGLQGGAKGEINLGPLLMKRLHLIGSTLRARAPERKAALVAAFLARFGADLEAGRLAPVVDRVLPMANIEDAHQALQASTHFGKIVLTT